MSEKPKCKMCGKIIAGVVKFIAKRKRSGKNIIEVLETYDEDCFTKIQKAKK